MPTSPAPFLSDPFSCLTPTYARAFKRMLRDLGHNPKDVWACTIIGEDVLTYWKRGPDVIYPRHCYLRSLGWNPKA